MRVEERIATSALCPARGDDLPESAGEIAACYALPGVWGLGVGHQMMDAATAWLRARSTREAKRKSRWSAAFFAAADARLMTVLGVGS